MTEKQRRARKQTEYERQASQFLERGNFTSDFFCKYDPDHDYVLTLKPTADGKVEPRCEKLKHGDDDARNKLIEERMQMISQLADVQQRTDKFEEMLKEYLDMEDTERKALDTELKAIDRDFESKIAVMQDYLVTLESRLSQCFDKVYSEHQNTFMQMTPTVCEPLSSVVENVNEHFYPRMFWMEELFGKAKSQAGRNSWRAYFADVIKKTIRYLWTALQKFKEILSVVTNAILTYAVGPMLAFGKAVSQKAFAKTQAFICSIASNPTSLIGFYNFLFLVLMKIADLNQKFISIVRDKVRSFCDPKEQKLLPLLSSNLDALKEEFGQLKDPTFQNALAIYAQYKTQADEIALDPSKCKGLKFFGRDGFDNKRVALLAWCICVMSAETIRKIVASSNLCKKSAEKVEEAKEEEEEEEESSDIEKSVDESVQDFSKTVQENEYKREVRNEPKLQPVTQLKDDAKTSFFSGLDYAPVFRKLDQKFKQTSMTGAEEALDNVISTLFSFFWFFEKHNFLGTKDVENGVAERYNLDKVLDGEGGTRRDLIGAELGKKIKDPDFRRSIPDYVLYAYCKAQNNTAEQCVDLVENGKPIHALANGEERYAYYLQQSKQIADGQDLEKQAQTLESPEEIGATVDQLLRDARKKNGIEDKQANNFQDDIARRLAVFQQQTQDFLPQEEPVAKPQAAKPQTVAPTTTVAPPLTNPLVPARPPAAAKPKPDTVLPPVTNPLLPAKPAVPAAVPVPAAKPKAVTVNLTPQPAATTVSKPLPVAKPVVVAAAPVKKTAKTSSLTFKDLLF